MREVLSKEQRSKLDPADDRQFYAFPRLVKHVDDGFLESVTELYRQRIPTGGAVLDLMSSWVSHLPSEASYSRVVGHGMNAAELAKNRQLDTFFVRNLNTEPDGVQYMQQPERVFAEIYRVLKPGGVCILTFSNRLFYDKAIAAWREGTGYSRCQLVRSYFQAVEGFTEPEVIKEIVRDKPQEANPLLRAFLTIFRFTSSDPFYAVVAHRNFKRIDN